MSAHFSSHHRSTCGERLQLAVGNVARQVLHAAVGGGDEAIRRQEFERAADAGCDGVGGLDRGIAEVEHAEQNRLARKLLQNAEIELWLCSLDRDLLRR